MKAAFYTLGCKVNQYESQSLSELFEKEGFEIARADEKADVFVVNSCTVTSTGDTKSKKTVNHIRKNNPDAVIALIGCFPQAFPQKAKNVENADIILGNGNKKQVIKLVKKALETREKSFEIKDLTHSNKMEEMSVSGFDERTRAFVKIQDGCNRFCSYCIIPTARGRICSKPLESLENEVKNLVKNGFSEIVLVGIDISSYGKEFGKTLVDAVETVSGVKGVLRIRLGSLEPEVLSDRDIKRLSQIKNFCPQFHLSLQSGCNETLKRMNRHYTAEQYAEIVKKLRGAFKNASVTTDVMVGFAGETQSEFEKSLDFVLSCKFLKVHVFPYSVRENTRAAEFENQVETCEKKMRAKKMISETEKMRKEILRSFVGRREEILVEGKRFGEYKMGYTPDYVPVYVKCSDDFEGKIVGVKICGVYSDGCLGELI